MGLAPRATTLGGDRETQFPNSTVEAKVLSDALHHGAVLSIGRYDFRLELEVLQSHLRRILPIDDRYRRDQLVGPTALCLHWLGFTGRRHGLNRSYPLPRLQFLIENCFGFPSFTMPADAVLAALTYRGFSVDRVKLGNWQEFGWAADIRGATYLPGDLTRTVPLAALGQRGALPLIKIEFPERL
jgi:hypothetical protein